MVFYTCHAICTAAWRFTSNVACCFTAFACSPHYCKAFFLIHFIRPAANMTFSKSEPVRTADYEASELRVRRFRPSFAWLTCTFYLDWHGAFEPKINKRKTMKRRKGRGRQKKSQPILWLTAVIGPSEKPRLHFSTALSLSFFFFLLLLSSSFFFRGIRTSFGNAVLPSGCGSRVVGTPLRKFRMNFRTLRNKKKRRLKREKEALLSTTPCVDVYSWTFTSFPFFFYFSFLDSLVCFCVYSF